MKRVGILGGTFNPIHMGHLVLAESARETFLLDEILFIPSGIPYMKEQETVLDARERVAMTSLAIEDNPCFALSTIETEKNSNSYTFETLAELHRRHPDTAYFFIIGADSLFHLENWKQPEGIFSGCTIIAAVRDNLGMEACRSKAEELKKQYQANILLLPHRMIDISSTEIRSRIRDHKSIRYMLPDQVIAYISRKKLYLE